MDLDRLESLVKSLVACRTHPEKIQLLEKLPQVSDQIRSSLLIQQLDATLNEEEQVILRSLVAIGQWELLSALKSDETSAWGSHRQLVEELKEVERFYSVLGGIVGYHWTLLSLLKQQGQPLQKRSVQYYPPVGSDISKETSTVRKQILEGLRALPFLAEIYPVGGAADRLRLFDPSNADPLPAALLSFSGYTLLDGLIRDLQAREYLYFKLFHKQIVTPIAMMTSYEKNNHEHVTRLCEARNWFGRGMTSFRFFCQPSVPVVDAQGCWCLNEKTGLFMKPGGHGVLWKVADEQGVFDWMQKLGRKKVLIRQINNPIAGVDYGLLAFCGVGFSENKQFGFASCSRQVASAEGVNVLVKRKEKDRLSYCLTNIEYCDFAKFSIEDKPVKPGDSYSSFPSNTNILFADLEAVKRGIHRQPIPGMLVNLKKALLADKDGQLQEREVVRLESTMQNLADCFEESVEAVSDDPLYLNEYKLSTFLTRHKRSKTISAIKKMWQPGSSLLETPEGSFYDQLVNGHELLTSYCHMVVPSLPTQEAYLELGPPFLFFYHPALGPLFSIIGQKIRGGQIHPASELSLEIAEVDIEDLELAGALHIEAENVVGAEDAEGVLRYSETVGRCVLRQVCVQNAGWNPRDSLSLFWKREAVYQERCEILIRGDGEFYAQGVTLLGSMKIEVKAGTRKTAFEEQGELCFREEPLSGNHWKYLLTAEDRIVLKKATG